MRLPRVVPVRQNFPDRRVRDIPAEVERQLGASGLADRLGANSTVAVGVGSRGIANLPVIVRAVVDYWKARGFGVFLFPAMGSHGAATAEGQADVLAHFGIDEASMGCPVRSSLEVVSTGQTAEGLETYLDKNAAESDGILVIGRVKWHTSFDGALESGLCKMLAIGAGKLAGAQRYHTYGYRLGMEQVIRTVTRQILKTGKILGGLAIVEDAHHNTAKLAVIAAERLESEEEELLALAKSWMGRLPLPLDVLMIDEIGKDISGNGMDTKVVNRGAKGENTFPDIPRIERIFVRDLTANTYGNAIGIGLADIVHSRVVPKIDWPATYLNALSASVPGKAKLPIHYPSDRECLERIAETTGRTDLSDLTLGWIKNSLELGHLRLSENLVEEIRKISILEVTGPAEELVFDSVGDLRESAWPTLH